MSQSHAHDHGHDHDHDHTPTVTSANERKVLVSFFLIFGFMLVEAVGGVVLMLKPSVGESQGFAASCTMAGFSRIIGTSPSYSTAPTTSGKCFGSRAST